MTFETISKIVQIVFADIILSGDNALVIGMAAAGLAPDLRKRAIMLGMALAAGLRILFAVDGTYRLAIKRVLLIGGLLLSWVCWRFLICGNLTALRILNRPVQVRPVRALTTNCSAGLF